MSASELLDLSAVAAVQALAAGELEPSELFEAYRVRAQEDELNCFTWVAASAHRGMHMDSDGWPKGKDFPQS